MQENPAFDTSLRVKAYFVFGVATYIFFYKLISSSMLSQMDHPVFIFPETEWGYQLFIASHIPQFVTSNTFLSALADISILISTIAFLFTRQRIYAVIFTLLVLQYFLTYNVVTGHHYHGLIGVLVISIPFWFKSETRFNLAWQLVRYYLLYIFASAALWKIMRGSAFYQEQLSNILGSQQINLLLQNSDTLRAHIAQYLISHAGVSHAILLVDVLVQLLFLIGFFTRRFDSFLFVLAIVFVIANYYVMSILSAELLILNLTLLNWQPIEDYLLRKEIILPKPS